MSSARVSCTVAVRETEAIKRTLHSVQRLTGAQELATALLELRGAGGRSGSKRRRFADRAMEVLQTSYSARELNKLSFACSTEFSLVAPIAKVCV